MHQIDQHGHSRRDFLRTGSLAALGLSQLGSLSAAEQAEFERLARLLGLEPSELSLG